VFLPYLAGERAPIWDPSRRGAFAGLSLEHARGDLARSVCESIGFVLKLVTDIAVSDGHRVDSIRVSGRLGGSELLCAIKADIIGIPVEVPRQVECEIIGCSIACAIALGEASGLADASRSVVGVSRTFEPRSDSRYSDSYCIFKDAMRALTLIGSSREHSIASPHTEII
jgi:xylulokinase